MPQDSTTHGVLPCAACSKEKASNCSEADLDCVSSWAICLTDPNGGSSQGTETLPVEALQEGRQHIGTAHWLGTGGLDGGSWEETKDPGLTLQHDALSAFSDAYNLCNGPAVILYQPEIGPCRMQRLTIVAMCLGCKGNIFNANYHNHTKYDATSLLVPLPVFSTENITKPHDVALLAALMKETCAFDNAHVS